MPAPSAVPGVSWWLRIGTQLAKAGFRRGPRASQAAVGRRHGGEEGAGRVARAPAPGAGAGRVRGEAQKVRADGYGVEQIQVLEGLEPVRKRPGMYIGSTGPRGLHHLVFEVLDNAVDEVQAGYCTDIRVMLSLGDGTVCVSDNGRGIPTDIHPQTGKSALETVLTVLHAGGKFGGDSSGYLASGGLHGVGVSVVNALSESMDVLVWRDGMEHRQTFSRGLATSQMATTPLESEKEKTGTQVKFRYDSTVFSPGIAIDPKTITSRMRELAFLNNRASLHLRVLGCLENFDGSGLGGKGSWETFHYKGGIKEYVQWVNRDRKPLHDPIYFSKEKDGAQVEVALQWCTDAFSETLLGYANSIKTVDGGTHMEGLKTSLTRTINALARRTRLLKDGDPNLGGDFIREGLGAVISVKVENPEFEGQTKTRLGTPAVRKIVDSIVSEEVGVALELDTSTLNLIVGKALQAYKAAEAAKKARELVRSKNILTRSTLPGKLADCSGSSDRETEIFLVEGDSAGGTAKQARDRAFQAILPLRGKILNAERRDETSVYKNKEVSSMIVALGLEKGGADGDLSNLRYDRVIILTDADVDGAHIRTLLLTFLFRFQAALFEQGKVFVAVPPLYKVQAGKKQQYFYSDSELQEATRRRAPGHVQRFKGLGEMMPAQLWQTTMNPESRVLRRLTTHDAAEASHMFSLLMGQNVEPRRELIEREGKNFGLSDLDI